MFKMVEIIGASDEGFSDAVKKTVQQLLKSGEKIHFFEVLEQRGAVRDGKFKEFQVKLKVAVETAASPAIVDSAEKSFCPTCQQTASASGHLCVPITKKDEKCRWCGALIIDERHACDGKVKELAYICNSCGRMAVSANHLCSPRKINKQVK